MALVEYSDSDESNTHNPSPPKGLQMLKRKRGETPQDLPPLPSTFHDLYSSTVRLSNQDDPTLHGGKERSKPHVEGQWPSHVYIECESTFLENLLLRDQKLTRSRVPIPNRIDDSKTVPRQPC